MSPRLIPTLRLAIAAVLVTSLGVACSDSSTTPSTNAAAGTSDAKSDMAFQVGDAVKTDGDAKTDSTDPTTEVADTAADVAVPDTGADVAPVGCTTNDECKGKVTLTTCQVEQCDTTTGTCAAATAPDDLACGSATDACFAGEGKCKAGTCDAKAVDCNDNNPCTDDTCDAKSGCQYANNTAACDDGKACTTGDACKDGKCTAGEDKCSSTETDCANKADDDADGAVDCDDNDCAADAACQNAKESDCTNKTDDDKDGKTDCEDADCGADPACQVAATEKDCTNKKDDDGDGAVDCDDNDCAADPACLKPTKEANCADKIDDDQDGKIDCDDSDCAQDVACKPTEPEKNCTNKIDDDKDGAVDCADNDCGLDLACQTTNPTAEADCVNKIDDDKDGKIDCADTDCAADLACQSTATEGNCTDKVDNDKDGKIDCLDADCAKDAACATKCDHDVCTVGKALKDGCDDCASKVCKADAFCCNAAGGEWDNICVNQAKTICGKQCGTGKESDCKNKVDDDADGLVDCQDGDCAADLACAATSCTADGKIACGSSAARSNGGAGSTNKVTGYQCKDGPANNETGPEYGYAFDAECDGALTVTVTKTSQKAGFLDLFVLDGAKTCAPANCLQHGLMNANTNTATVTVKDAKKGAKYIAVIDGFAGAVGDFSIKIGCGCAGGKEVACADKLDNDGDSLTDCQDSDCAAELACAPTVETLCTNKIDDDKDGKIDCNDSDCAANLACQSTTTELNCADKVDNDKDGKADCDDTDCAKNAACLPPTTEVDCTNKVDDDKDGKVDCLDPDCAKDAACSTPPENCTNKIDDDKDGKIDCLDVDCIGNSACSCKPTGFTMACNDNDQWNNGGFGSTKVVNNYVCNDGPASNETGPEYTYSYTSQCDGSLTVTLTRPTAGPAGFLDLFVLDAAKGCAGNTCIGHAAMVGNTATKVVQVKKGQKLFINVDGYQGYQGTYQLKTNCKCAPQPETKCDNKIDDDNDGKTDCDDSDCAAVLPCSATPTTETNCADKIDNDKDGKIDCLDTDCAKDLACAPTPTGETNCTDKVDNDKDGKVDCADSDCAGKTGCVCQGSFPASCGSNDTFNNGGFGSTKVVNEYQCPAGKFANEVGPEYGYNFTAQCDGNVTVNLQKTASAPGNLDVFVIDASAGKACAGSNCIASAQMKGTATNLTFVGKKDQKYWIVVDGFGGFAGGYTIKTTCNCPPPPKETNCTDKIDNDQDGKIDCADSDCAGNPACAAPNQCKDDLPIACGGSDEWNNGDEGSSDVVSSYQCLDGNVTGETGPEYSYSFTATCDGPAVVKLTKTGFLAGGLLDLFLLDGDKPCAGDACLAHALMQPFAGSVQKTFTVVKGKKYHLVVDGFSNYSTDYKITVACCGK
jgi:hypothetical protein